MNDNQVARYFISTDSKSSKKWVRIFIDFIPTNYEMNRNGEVRDIRTHKLLTPYHGNYITYPLMVEGRKYNMGIHRLMACLFIPIPRKFVLQGLDQMHLVPNHKDGDKHHNVLDNLEWTDVRGNTLHAIENGMADGLLGENSHLAKITNDDAKNICELLSKGIRPSEVAEITAIPISIIRHIYSGETWRQLSRNYDFKKDDDRSIPYSIPDKKIHRICELICTGKYEPYEIENITGVSARYISDIWNKKRRTDISSQYNFPTRKEMKESLVKEICERLQENQKIRSIAESLGVSDTFILDIKHRKIYTDISEGYIFHETFHIDKDKVRQVCELLSTTQLSYAEISKKTGISAGSIKAIKLGKNHKDISKDYDFSNRS